MAALAVVVAALIDLEIQLSFPYSRVCLVKIDDFFYWKKKLFICGWLKTHKYSGIRLNVVRFVSN